MFEDRALPMIGALMMAFGYFAYVMYGKTRLLLIAQHRADLFEDIPKRLTNMIVFAFGQKKMFKEKKAGFMHAFIFWGFLVLQIRTLYLILTAFFPDLEQPHLYALVKDVTEVVVLTMVCYAVYRRVVEKPKRLTHSVEALVVLGMIGGLVVSDFLLDGFNFAYAEASGGMTAAIESEMAWSPVGVLFSNIVGGIFSPELLRAGAETFYWTHIGIVLVFLNMLPGSKHFHVITSIPNTLFGEVKAKGALLPIENIEDQETFGVGNVKEFTWRQVLDMYSCTECGRCTVNCPTTITGKPLNPKLLICDTRDHLYKRESELLADADGEPSWDLIEDVGYDAIWDCTTCRACSEACPVSIEHVDKIIDMRRRLVLMEGRFPKEFAQTLKNIEGKGNPWGLPKGDRTAWADELDVPTLKENPDAEYLFWVGCAGAYDDKQKKVSRALVALMREAGLNFATMGKKETCTGDPARRGGNEYLFQTLAETNIKNMNKLGVDKMKVVTHCPHCFNTLANEYPQFGGQYEVLHHSSLIQHLIGTGKLKPTRKVDGVSTVTYHDSCYIGRYNDVYEEPRQALAAIPGVTLKEMDRNRTTGMCCGAGGARVWMEEHRGTRINQERVKHAMETKADTIAVACPFCNVMMSDGVNELGIEGVKTRDIAELVAESVGVGDKSARAAAPESAGEAAQEA